MRTNEVARQAGVHGETLRYYEQRGLLKQPPRTPSGYRDYPAEAVDLLRFVRRAQKLGFTLDEIKELLDLNDGGPANCDAARSLAESRRSDLDARITDLQRMRESLGRLIASCDLPRADRRCALLEAIEADTEASNR